MSLGGGSRLGGRVSVGKCLNPHSTKSSISLLRSHMAVASQHSRRRSQGFDGAEGVRSPLSPPDAKSGSHKWFRIAQTPREPENWRGCAAFWAVLGSLLVAACPAAEPSAEAPAPPAADSFLVVPLRVHVFTADEPDINCNLTDADVKRVIGKVNAVWRCAGVHFGLESIVREPAAASGVERFRRVRQQLAGTPMSLYPALIPEASRGSFRGLHVYYVHKLPVNGVYMGKGYAFVQETAVLREVEGGIDEPVPRVTAHELGHALGLSHRQDRTNLMASGTTGTLLNPAEVAAAREGAGKIDGAMTIASCREAADAAVKSGDDVVARRMRGWITEIEAAPAK